MGRERRRLFAADKGSLLPARSALVAALACAWLPVAANGSAAPAPGWPLSIQVRDPAGASRRLPERFHIRAEDDTGVAIDLTVDGRTLLTQLPAAGRWRLCLELPISWSECQTVDTRATGSASPEAPTSVVFTAWPAVRVRGRVRPAESGTPLERVTGSLQVRAGPSPGRRPPQGFRDTWLECTLGEKGNFFCTAPAAAMFVAVRAKGFVGRYFWNLAPKAGEDLDLGTIGLQAGASLVGEVDVRSDGVRHELVKVRLSPAIGPGEDAATTIAVGKDSHQVPVTQHGFFQVTGLRPGSYMLEATHPAFARTELGPFDVFPGAETRLRDLVRLLPPIELTLGIEPALSPGDRPWKVQVFREHDWSAGSSRVFSGIADAAGAVRIPGQSPGLFRIAVEDDKGNRFAAVTTRIEPVDSGFVPVRVQIVPVRGKLFLGSEPLAAALHFGGTSGSQRALMKADAGGAFAGALPHDGEWRVDIESSEPPLATTRRVEVKARGDGTAELEIVLEETALVGRVVSPDGEPIEEARIKVDTPSEAVYSRARSNAAGEFRFRALPPGRAMASATATIAGRQGTSSAIWLTLQKDVTAGPIELVVRPMHEFEGRVMSASGPVPGARLSVTTLDRPIPSGASSVSDFEGQFTFELPEAEGLAAFTFLPPGGFLTTTIERLRSPVELRAEGAGGTVRLTLPESADASTVMLQRDGVYIDPGMLMQWARGHGLAMAMPTPGETVTYPRLAVGSYRLCAVAESVRRRRLQEGDNWQQVFDSATRCATGSLAPGGTLELSLVGKPAATAH